MLKSLADFEQQLSTTGGKQPEQTATAKDASSRNKEEVRSELDLRLSYTINLVLPKTDDPAVFNAIFKALREHLLRK